MTQYSLVNQFPTSIPTWIATVANQLQTDGDWFVYAWSDGSNRHDSSPPQTVGDLSTIHSYVELSRNSDGTGKGIAFVNATGGTTTGWMFYNTISGWSTATGPAVGSPTAIDNPTDRHCFNMGDVDSSTDYVTPNSFPMNNTSVCHLIYDTDGFLVSFGWDSSFNAQFIFGVLPVTNIMPNDIDPCVYLAHGTDTGIAAVIPMNHYLSYCNKCVSGWFGRTTVISGVYRNMNCDQYFGQDNTMPQAMYGESDPAGYYHPGLIRCNRGFTAYTSNQFIKGIMDKLYWNTGWHGTGTPFNTPGTTNKVNVAFVSLILPWTGTNVLPVATL